MDFGKEVLFIHSAIKDLQLKSFDPFTHIFVFAHGYQTADIEKALDLLLMRWLKYLINT
jgi:transcriptional regulatory protein LevR